MSAVGEIHRFHPGATSAAPTLLLLHGTGGNEDDLLPLGRELSPSTSFLAPRGPVLENGMPRFFRRIGNGVFDLEDLAARTRELGAFIRGAADRYGFDATRLFAVGYSNGANIAASLLLTDPTPLAGALLYRAMLPFEPDEVPDLDGRPVLLAAGRSDPYVPTAQVEGLAEALRRGNARVELSWTGAGHGLEPEDLAQGRAWLGREAG